MEKSDARKLYAQALARSTNIKEILKIKEMFLNLNMIIKESSRKQVIIPMSNKNKNKFMESSSVHIMNLNRALKGIKSEVMADFVCSDQVGIIIITNKVVSSLNLQTIEKYIKNSNHIDVEKVKIPCLSQSKLYLKITGIFYMIENTNTPISVDVVKTIIKNNHIFNNIVIASRPCIIKVSLKFDITIIWLDIWDIQSGSNAKKLINRCFNVGRHIATIRGVNMNSGIL